MTGIVLLAASVSDLPAISEVDAMLEELRRMPRTVQTTALTDDLLEFRLLLAETSTGQSC
nr:hypothetical protein [Parafrankia irregularis]